VNLWFRMYSEFATDPKVQSLSEVMQRRLVMLFCLRCGDVLVTLRERDIAFALRVTPFELAETKALFVESGFIDEDWRIINWSKRQFVSDSSTNRTRAYRERMRTSRDGHSDGLDTDTDTDTEEIHKNPSPKNGSGTAHGSRFDLTEIPAEWREWAAKELCWAAARADKTFAVFGDYWRAVVGAKGRKADWLGTWRNWCRREDGAPSQNGRAPFPQKLTGAERMMALAQKRIDEGMPPL
jgi:hypothetical protein